MDPESFLAQQKYKKKQKLNSSLAYSYCYTALPSFHYLQYTRFSNNNITLIHFNQTHKPECYVSVRFGAQYKAYLSMSVPKSSRMVF